jgi:hypothetical protein
VDKDDMKFASDRSYSDPEKPPAKILEIANGVEPVQDGRIHIEKVNWPFLFRARGTPAECKAGLDLAIEHDWQMLHESGTFVRFTQTGCRPVRLIRILASAPSVSLVTTLDQQPARAARRPHFPEAAAWPGLIARSTIDE